MCCKGWQGGGGGGGGVVGMGPIWASEQHAVYSVQVTCGEGRQRRMGWIHKLQNIQHVLLSCRKMQKSALAFNHSQQEGKLVGSGNCLVFLDMIAGNEWLEQHYMHAGAVFCHTKMTR